MKQLSIKPTVYQYETFKDFADEFKLGAKDVILTNAWIHAPAIEKCNLDCKVVLQQKYGGGEPTDAMVQGILDEIASLGEIDRIIAVGGGTIIDISKIACLGGETDIYAMYDSPNLTKKRELIIVPTTAGTGSEVTNIAVVNLTKKGIKKGLVSDYMYADKAVLIPEFIPGAPYKVFATSAIDALVHACEAYLNIPKATDYTDIFAKAAITDILDGFKKIVAVDDEAARKAIIAENSAMFLRASNYAGIAFCNSSCGAVHAMSYAFGAKYHVAHGESNYQFFTAVLDFYKKAQPEGKWADFEAYICNILGGDDAVKAIDDLLEKLLPLKKMSEYGAVQDDIAPFAKSTYDEQQRLLSGNYIPMTEADLAALFQARL